MADTYGYNGGYDLRGLAQHYEKVAAFWWIAFLCDLMLMLVSVIATDSIPITCSVAGSLVIPFAAGLYYSIRLDRALKYLRDNPDQ